jgi:hypothetical protein
MRKMQCAGTYALNIFFLKDRIMVMMKKKAMPAKSAMMTKAADKTQDKKDMAKMAKDKMSKVKKKPMSGYK